MDKLRMQTANKADENFRKLAAMFPNAVTETINENGEVVRAIDKDVLMQEIACTVLDGNEERYQFTWPDKKKSVLLANAPINKTLRPVREDESVPTGADSEGKPYCSSGSVNFDTTENLYIEGDNLEVLKLLQETYLGKIKMIYIDPPYNTGNDFVYEDDFAQSTDEYLANSGQYDEDGNRMVQNTESNGRFHTDWLNMIYPRLKLAKDLLADDGVIFISIDDGEAANLIKLCNDVMGEANFVADLIWQKKFSRANDATYFSTMHDHILCYCKQNIMMSDTGWRIGLLPRGEEIPNGYSNPDNDPRGVWTSVILSAKSGSESLLYEIETPSGRKVYPPSGRFWSCSKETFEKWKAGNRIWFGANGDGTPRKKTFLSEVQSGLRPNTILFQDDVGNNQEAKQETKALFDGLGVFDGPKPVRLLTTLLRIANTESDAIIGKIAEGTVLTRRTVSAILQGIRVDKLYMFRNNPEEFISKVIRLINEQKATMIVEHISYDTIEGEYDSSIFTAEKATQSFDKAFLAKKAIQDYVFTDGSADKSIERKFAEDLDAAEEVCVYAKLPRTFQIPTPVGNYSPDWAIAFYEGTVKHIFFIAETKGTMESLELRPIEQAKISCAKKLFNEMSTSNVVYHDVDSYQSLLSIMSFI